MKLAFCLVSTVVKGSEKGCLLFASRTRLCDRRADPYWGVLESHAHDQNSGGGA
jgi:hypothetical protein